MLYKAFWGDEGERKENQMKEEVKFKRADELLIERFEEWLARNNYSEKTIRNLRDAIKRIFRVIGFPTVEKLDEKYGLLPSTTKKWYFQSFYRFQEFLRSSLTEEEKRRG